MDKEKFPFEIKNLHDDEDVSVNVEIWFEGQITDKELLERLAWFKRKYVAGEL